MSGGKPHDRLQTDWFILEQKQHYILLATTQDSFVEITQRVLSEVRCLQCPIDGVRSFDRQVAARHRHMIAGQQILNLQQQSQIQQQRQSYS